MYATVPVMYLVLVILFFERIVTYCKSQSSILGKLKSALFIQVVIVLIWIVAIVLISVFIYLKNRAKNSVGSLTGKYLPKKWKLPLSEMLGVGQCSIDGQLLPMFKILFLVLLILIIVLFIKSTVLSFIYSFGTLSCFGRKEKGKTSANDHMTLTFIIILFLNLAFSFPFYFVSTANSIVDTFRGEQSFTTKLKICFILRLISIILQCFVFYTLDSGCWSLLQKIIDCVIKQKPRPKRNINHNDRGRLPVPASDSDDSAEPSKTTGSTKKPAVPKSDSSSSSSSEETSSDDSDDEVFTSDPEHVSGKAEKCAKTKSTSTDSSDSDDKGAKLPAKENNSSNKIVLKREQSIKDRPVTKETKPKSPQTNGLSKTTPPGKPTSPLKSPTKTDQKTSKSTTIEIPKKSDPGASSNSSPTGSANSSQSSDNKIQSTIIESEVRPIIRVPSSRVRSPRRYRSYQQHWTSRVRIPQSAPPISTQPKYTKLPTNPTKSSETTDNHARKPREHSSQRTRIHSTAV